MTHRDDVEAGGTTVVQAVPLQVVTRGQDDPLSLAEVDALTAAAEAVPSTIPDLDEDDRLPGLHDEIDLP